LEIQVPSPKSWKISFFSKFRLLCLCHFQVGKLSSPKFQDLENPIFSKFRYSYAWKFSKFQDLEFPSGFPSVCCGFPSFGSCFNSAFCIQKKFYWLLRWTIDRLQLTINLISLVFVFNSRFQNNYQFDGKIFLSV